MNHNSKPVLCTVVRPPINNPLIVIEQALESIDSIVELLQNQVLSKTESVMVLDSERLVTQTGGRVAYYIIC